MANNDQAAKAALEELQNQSAAPEEAEEQSAQEMHDDATGVSEAVELDDQGEDAGADDDSAASGQRRGGDLNVALSQARQQAREAREAMRRLEAQAEERQQAMIAMADRLAGMNAQGAPASQGQPAQPTLDPYQVINQKLMDEPDPFEDPDGYQRARAHNNQIYAAQQDVLRQIASERMQTQQQTAAQQRQQHIIGQAIQFYEAQKQDFAIEAPDYPQAEQWLANGLVQEFMAMGLPEQAARQRVDQYHLQAIGEARRQGRNTAEMIYAVAKQRGYQPGMTAADAQAGGAPQTTAQQVERRAANAQKTRSLGAARGGAPSGALTLEKYVAMSPKEKLTVSPKQYREMFKV